MTIEMVERLETRWQSTLNDLTDRIGTIFRRDEAKTSAYDYLRGLLSSVERKNSWQIAESVGNSTPYSIQHLLGRAKWDADLLRDKLQSYVCQHLGSDDGVAILDETGFLKKGQRSAGVQRQYSGTAGRIENCQVGVFLAYAGSKGRTFLDRALYLPKSWINDQELRNSAGVPDKCQFATKPQLGVSMLERAFASKIPIAWVTGDCVYGGDYKLRSFLVDRKQPYVLSVKSDQCIWKGFQQIKVKELETTSLDWQRFSCGNGSKGERFYDWALFPLHYDAPVGMRHSVLLRRSLSKEGEISFYFAFSAEETSLQNLSKVAGSRWAVEECFQTAKGEVGLDQYEVRSWNGWYRHVTLSLLAHAFLTIQRAEQLPKKKRYWPREPDDPTFLPGNQKLTRQVCSSTRSTIHRANLQVVALAKSSPVVGPVLPL